ncbi:MAG: alkaline phosphatase D family protein [Bacteroidales bacterium]|nr:alkaline phosphatase D family protein [Bacteroidales bacterium]
MKIYFLTSVFLIALYSLLGQSKNYSKRLDKSFDPIYAPFYHGVASGDPLSDRVIIWTRVTDFSFGSDSIPVQWFVCLDTCCQQVIKSGYAYASASRDFCVKVDVTGLQPDTWYYYYFRALGRNSVLGRTRTLPVGNNLNNLRFGFFHGSNYNSGYYNALRDLANRNDVDFMIHLGDYIYEYGTGGYGNHPDRWVVPDWDIVTLSDYRARYSHYRLDPDLRWAHQQYPWFVIWDDHEVANNAWRHGAENHDSTTQGSYEVRRACAIQAFMEWMPLRPVNNPQCPDNHIRKYFDFGDLARLILIDSRHEARMAQDALPNNDPNKTMLGEVQYQWITQALYESYHNEHQKWRIIGNQVMFVPLKILGQVVNNDQWDGYMQDRQRIMNFIRYTNIKNNVIITGDIHTSWACDVPDPYIGQYGPNGQGCSNLVEFVSPSITSPSFPFGNGVGVPLIISNNPHIKWADLIYKGYSILDIKPMRVHSDWFFVSTIDNPDSFQTNWAQGWYVNKDENFLRMAYAPALPLNTYPSLSGEKPFSCQQDSTITQLNENGHFTLLSLFPNPNNGRMTIQYHLKEPQTLTFHVLDMHQKLVYQESITPAKFDIQYHGFNLHLPAGQYYLLIYSNQKLLGKIPFVIVNR